MRRYTLFCVRNFYCNNLKGLISAIKSDEQSWISLGAQAECLSTECKAERPFDASEIPNYYSKYRVFETSEQAVELVRQGCRKPNPIFYNRWLQKCGDLGDLREGSIAHTHVLRSEFKDDISIHNNIFNMYVKCGDLSEAWRCFEEMPFKETGNWTCMIIAFTQNGRPEDVLSLLPKMIRLGLKPSKFTFSSLLKASCIMSSFKHGMLLHTLCIKYGCDSNVYVGTSLLHMYAKSGFIDEAQSIFDGLMSKNEVSWNALIAGRAKKGEGEKAISLFQRMERENFEPNCFTYSSLLNACAGIGVLEQGKWIHAHILKSGVKPFDFVGHTLLHMYAKCGSIEDAEKVFTRLRDRDVVSWNSMLNGYAQHGDTNHWSSSKTC